MEPKRQLFIGLGIGGAFLLLFGPGLLRWVELEARQSSLRGEIVALKTENQRLIEETRRLREDPAYLEAVARRELGFARPGEMVVKFRTKAAANAQRKTSANR